jgi:hypothetical protein
MQVEGFLVIVDKPSGRLQLTLWRDADGHRFVPAFTSRKAVAEFVRAGVDVASVSPHVLADVVDRIGLPGVLVDPGGLAEIFIDTARLRSAD